MPTDKRVFTDLNIAMKAYFRRIHLRGHFLDNAGEKKNYFNEKLKPKSTWVPDKPPVPPCFSEYCEKTREELLSAFSSQRNLNKIRHNLSRKEHQALEELATNPDIKVCKADKNLGPCLVSPNWYEDQIQLHLHTAFRRVEHQQAIAIQRRFLSQVRNWACTKDCTLDNRVVKLLQETVENSKDSKNPLPRFARIYLLIKVHKNPISTRPITPAFDTITHYVSKFMDLFLQPYLRNCGHLCTGSLDLVKEIPKISEISGIPGIPGITRISKKIKLVTLDIQTLYPSIPIDVNTKRALYTLFQRTFGLSTRLSNWLVEGIFFVLGAHVVEHKGEFHHQISGTAMGVELAVVFANCYVLALENKHQLLAGTIFYRRFIDDIFAMVYEDNLQTFLERFQKDPGRLQFTYEVNDNSANFLDVTIYKDTDGALQTKLYTKPLNRFLFLPFNTYHTNHTKRGFIRGYVQRIIRLSSTFETYLKDRNAFVEQLRHRAYPLNFITSSISGLRYEDRSKHLEPKQKNSKPPLVFVLEHNPKTQGINIKKILLKHWHILMQSQRYIDTLTTPIIASTLSSNIESHIKRPNKHIVS